jgi:glutathione peroxidase
MRARVPRAASSLTKFLVDRHGKPVARYAPQLKPEDLEEPIRKLL